MATIIRGDDDFDTAENGRILQVVEFHRSLSDTSSALVSSSSSYGDIYSKSITTKQANSKILVLINCVGYSNNGVIRAAGRVFRDSTEIGKDLYAWYSPQSTMATWQFKKLDSPNVAAGTTLNYKLQGTWRSNGTAYLGYADSSGRSMDSITLIEVAS